MADENGSDRREIDKLRAKLEEERFDSLKTLINTRFDRVDEKFEGLEKRLNDHISSPHNLADIAKAAASVPPISNNGSYKIPGLAFIARFWLHIIATSGFLAGTSSYVIKGCGGGEVHYHSPAELTATAATPSPTKGDH